MANYAPEWRVAARHAHLSGLWGRGHVDEGCVLGRRGWREGRVR